MDCPYYEQLQNAMDPRLEALHPYAVSSDTALVRKALIDFPGGLQPEGLISSKASSAYLQILSTFSLHDIFTLCDDAARRDGPALLRLCRGDIDRILDCYDARIGADSLVSRLGFWEFVGWQDAGSLTAGTPGWCVEADGQNRAAGSGRGIPPKKRKGPVFGGKVVF